jgi:hypothetical protein
MINSLSNGKPLQESPETPLLRKLAENMTSVGLSVRKSGTVVALVPDAYLTRIAPDMAVEEERRQKLSAVAPLRAHEFDLTFRRDKRVHADKSGDLSYQLPLFIKTAGTGTTNLHLVDPGGVGLFTTKLRQRVNANMASRTAEIEARRTEYVEDIEKRLNDSVDERSLMQLALHLLRERRVFAETHKSLTDAETASLTGGSNRTRKDEAVRERDQYVAELSNIDALVRAFESRDKRAKATFGIIGRGTVGLKISLREPGPWGQGDSDDNSGV